MSILKKLYMLLFLFAGLTCLAQDGGFMKKFADKLHDNHICADNNYEKLLLDIHSNRLGNPIDFLKYCDKAIVVDLKDYPDEPEKYLLQIHNETASLIPGLTFSNFKFQIVLDSSISDNSFKTYNVIISLKSKGKIYKQKSFIKPAEIGQYKEMGYFGKIDQQEYYKIFNKILADIQSPYRLHEVKAYKGNAVDWNRFGVIALTKKQADVLHGGGVYFTPSYEGFKNSLTSARIDTAIAEFKKQGLLSHLNTAQISAAQIKVSQQENYNLNDVLQCFPDVIYFFDSELSVERPYNELLKNMSLISKGTFAPANIIDNFSIPEKDYSLLKFSFNGKEYTKYLKVDDDWVDPDVFEFIKQVLSDNKLDGQFYELYTAGQEISIIFLTAAQADYLRRNSLLIFADQWQLVEEF